MNNKKVYRLVHINLPQEIYLALQEVAEKEYRKITALVNKAIVNYLKSKKIFLNN